MTHAPFEPPFVVLVNHDPVQLAEVSAMLAHEGLQIARCRSASEAMRAMLQRRPALVIMDLDLPEIGGWGFCRMLRSPGYREFNQTPILIISDSFAGSKAVAIAVELGASDLLSAPINANQLRERVRHLLSVPEQANIWKVLLAMPAGAEEEALRNVFVAQGCKVRGVADAYSLAATLQKEPWETVVYDLDLPGASTGHMSELILAFPQAGFIAVTANLAPEAAVASLRSGASAHLRRPFAPDYVFGLCDLARQKNALIRARQMLEQRTLDLHSSERLMQAVLDSSDEIHLVLDTNGVVEVVNAAAQEISSKILSRPLREGDSLFRFMPAEMRRQVRSSLAAAAGGRVVEHEAMLLDRAENQLHFIVRYMPLRGTNGQARLVCLNAHDVTARTQQEADLRASQTRLQALFEHSHDAILMAGDDGHFLEVNPAAARMLGYTREQLLGLGIDAVFATSDRSLSERAWEEFLVHGTQSGECTLRRKDGTSLRADYSAVAHILPGVHLTIMRDLSERVALQSQLLRQQRLESVGRLASGVAHDLNNILTPILMAPEMLRAYVNDTGGRMLLDTMEAGARRGSAIVHQLLAFSRGESGEKTRLEFKKVLRDACTIIRETFPKNITLDAVPASGEFPILGDPQQLQQVVVNLAINAADAMPRGGRLVFGVNQAEISAEAAERDTELRAGTFVLLTVADHGLGIAPEIMDKIFDPFFTTKPFGQGSGLGLSVVLGIVRGHGGFVQVSSRVGVGTLFKVYLPLCLTPPPTSTPFSPSASPRTAPTGGGRTVLVVDDEAAVRDIMRLILVREGFRVMCADGADAAFSQLQAASGRVDLILTDMAMPGVSGVKFIEQLRSRRADVAILIMTGNEGDFVLPDTLRHFIRGVITKPCEATALILAVSKALTPDTHT